MTGSYLSFKLFSSVLGTDFVKADGLQGKLGSTLVDAYQKARNSVDEDWEIAAELEKAGVSLPAGWRPASPLHMEEGEFMTEYYS